MLYKYILYYDFLMILELVVLSISLYIEYFQKFSNFIQYIQLTLASCILVNFLFLVHLAITGQRGGNLLVYYFMSIFFILAIQGMVVYQICIIREIFKNENTEKLICFCQFIITVLWQILLINTYQNFYRKYIQPLSLVILIYVIIFLEELLLIFITYQNNYYQTLSSFTIYLIVILIACIIINLLFIWYQYESPLIFIIISIINYTINGGFTILLLILIQELVQLSQIEGSHQFYNNVCYCQIFFSLIWLIFQGYIYYNFCVEYMKQQSLSIIYYITLIIEQIAVSLYSYYDTGFSFNFNELFYLEQFYRWLALSIVVNFLQFYLLSLFQTRKNQKLVLIFTSIIYIIINIQIVISYYQALANIQSYLNIQDNEKLNVLEISINLIQIMLLILWQFLLTYIYLFQNGKLENIIQKFTLQGLLLRKLKSILNIFLIVVDVFLIIKSQEDFLYNLTLLIIIFALFFNLCFNLQTLFVAFGRNYVKKRYVNLILCISLAILYIFEYFFIEYYFIIHVQVIWILNLLHSMKKYSMRSEITNYNGFLQDNLSCILCKDYITLKDQLIFFDHSSDVFHNKCYKQYQLQSQNEYEYYIFQNNLNQNQKDNNLKQKYRLLLILYFPNYMYSFNLIFDCHQINYYQFFLIQYAQFFTFSIYFIIEIMIYKLRLNLRLIILFHFFLQIILSGLCCISLYLFIMIQFYNELCENSLLIQLFQTIYKCHIILILAQLINERILYIKVAISYYYEILFLYLILDNIYHIFGLFQKHFQGYYNNYFEIFVFYDWYQVSILIIPKILTLLFLGEIFYRTKNDQSYHFSKLKKLNQRIIVFQIIIVICQILFFIQIINSELLYYYKYFWYCDDIQIFTSLLVYMVFYIYYTGYKQQIKSQSIKLTKKSIEQKPNMIKVFQQKCYRCKTQYFKGDIIIYQTLCQHSYHKKCIILWINYAWCCITEGNQVIEIIIN